MTRPTASATGIKCLLLLRQEQYNKWIKEQVEYAKEGGMDYKVMAKAFISTEPYCNYNEVIRRIKEVYEIE